MNKYFIFIVENVKKLSFSNLNLVLHLIKEKLTSYQSSQVKPSFISTFYEKHQIKITLLIRVLKVLIKLFFYYKIIRFIIKLVGF